MKKSHRVFPWERPQSPERRLQSVRAAGDLQSSREVQPDPAGLPVISRTLVKCQPDPAELPMISPTLVRCNPTLPSGR